jgi:hypothetical protein
MFFKAKGLHFAIGIKGDQHSQEMSCSDLK